MALHINLYHEVLRQEIQRKRDPLKLSIYVLVAVAALLVGYYMLRFGQVRYLQNQVRAKSNEWTQVEPKASAARKESAEIGALLKTSETLVTRIEGRFFWAPLFEELVKIAPKDVQITNLNGEMQRDKPGAFILMVSGLAAGGEPRKTAEDFRTGLQQALAGKYKQVTAVFRSLDESSEKAVVNAQAMPTVNFTIYIRNNDSSAEAAATAPKP
jgi:hypothetical protein